MDEEAMTTGTSPPTVEMLLAHRHWLRALETLIAEKGLLSADALAARRDAWDRAARATPHGEPIVLGRDQAG